ncbi:MAG: MFS transporter [Solirubrobacterales bacterium]|nr:MFS transporter [Solirubrobacterales bacterium]MBV9603780.1 MFS transporter [Solirubrobacterales bacterium]
MAPHPLRRNREFLLLWSGQAISQLGSQVSLVAYPLLVLAVTGSPAKAGLVGFARNVPVAALALPAGWLADRVNRKYLMVASDGVRALAMASIPAALAAGSVPYALIVAVAAIDGIGFVVSYVAERGALRQLVAPEQLGEAVTRNESRTFGAMLAGPPLGGLLFGIARAIPFVADAVSSAVSTVTKLLIATEFQEARVDEAFGGAREGLRWLWQRPFLRNSMLLFAGSNPIFSGLYLLIVVLARHHGASSASVGLMLGIAAGGGLLGALLAPRLQRRMTARGALVGESWAMTASIPLLLVAPGALLLGAIVAVAELITPVTNSFVVGYRVALAPDRLQGRVQAASTLISFSAGWAGPLVVGLLLQGAGETATVLALTGWALVLAVAATGSRAFRHPPTLDAPGSASPSLISAS